MLFLRGLLFRLGLGALPLVVVILLCCLMMGWPGRARNQEASSIAAQPELTAQAAVVPPAERVTFPNGAQSDAPPAIAKFQTQHILHALVRVPN